MDMDRCDQFLLAGYAQALAVHGRSVGRVHAQLARALDDHVGSQGRERVL